MQPPVLPFDEPQRLQRLRRLGLLDTGAEAVLDGFTELAASVTGMPIALISLIDEDRQWWKSAVGLPQGGGTPRALSFCGHAIAAGPGLFEIEDARLDPRFADNPIVLGPPQVTHYAGVPLVMPGGERIGTLCVIDAKPGRLAPQARDILARLARSIVDVLLLRESERDQRERAMADARFRTIAEALPQMVWSTNDAGQPDYFNQRWYEFTGMPPLDSPHAHPSALLHPDDLQAAQAGWQRSVATGQPYEQEYRLRHRSGDYRWVLTRALPVKDGFGRGMRWMGTCTDIQDQKLAQEELQAASHRKDEFLAMLAHELRNPLAPLSMAAQLLQMAADEPERVRDSARLIERQVRHMTELVDDLLDVSRVTRGLVTVERREVELGEVLQGALEQARPLIESRGHQVKLELPPAPLHVRGDRVRLVQVVSNLLNNAAKYTQPGGHIGLMLRREGAHAHIGVQDNGSGIEPRLLRHVFELFTQGQRTPDRAQGGLGLGLALVKSLVELHGGHVRAHSGGPGRGSTFTVCLPLIEPANGVAQAAPASASPAPHPPLRVMVVDDNVDAGQMLGHWLQALGHDVRIEVSPLAALACSAQAGPMDVYLLDIGLPQMDGYELARRLRQQPGLQQATFIAGTGDGQARDIAQSKQAGFDYHFVKPLDPARLLKVLEQVPAHSAPPA